MQVEIIAIRMIITTIRCTRRDNSNNKIAELVEIIKIIITVELLR